MRKEVPAVALLDWTRSASDRQASEVLGITATRGANWRTRGRLLTVAEAEDLCDRLRIHPIDVWIDWYDYVSRA